MSDLHDRPPLPGELAWYVTGRFYAAADGSLCDAGYFLHLQGISGDLFGGAPGEGTARLTFASTPFHASELTNGDLTLGLDTVGEFAIYLNDRPAASFDDPGSFAAGEPVARFRRRSVVVGVTVAGAGGAALVSMNVFSAALVWSAGFELGGRRYDLRRLLPHGVTQWGTASTRPVVPSPAGFTSAVPFAGSAVAIGPASPEPA